MVRENPRHSTSAQNLLSAPSLPCFNTIKPEASYSPSGPAAVQTSEAQLTVLLIEDNAGDARLLMEYLSDAPANPFVLEHVQTLGEGLERVRDLARTGPCRG